MARLVLSAAFLAFLAAFAWSSEVFEETITEIPSEMVQASESQRTYIDNTVSSLQKQFSDLQADIKAKKGTKGVRATIDTMTGMIDTILPMIKEAAETDQRLLNTEMSAVETLNGEAQTSQNILLGTAKDIRTSISDHNTLAGQWKTAADEYLKSIKSFEDLMAAKTKVCCEHQKASVPDVESTPAYVECDFKSKSGADYTRGAIAAMKTAVASKLKAGYQEYKRLKSSCEGKTAAIPGSRTAMTKKQSSCDEKQAATRAKAASVKTDLPELKKNWKTQKEEYETNYKRDFGKYTKAKKDVERQVSERSNEWKSVMQIRCLLVNYKDGGTFSDDDKKKCEQDTENRQDTRDIDEKKIKRVHHRDLSVTYPKEIKPLTWSLGDFNDLTSTSPFEEHCSKREDIPPTPVCAVVEPTRPTCSNHDMFTKAPTKAPTNTPTKAPSRAPTEAPTQAPTKWGRCVETNKAKQGTKTSTTTGWLNDWDGVLNWHTKQHRTHTGFMTGLKSKHRNDKEDRRFRARVTSGRVFQWKQPFWESGQTGWDATWQLECHANQAIVGLESHHRNDKEDRVFKIRCAQVLHDGKEVNTRLTRR